MTRSSKPQKKGSQKTRTLLTRGNSKVGEDVLLFSIPAGGKCCPGATEACKSVCYALRPHTWMAERWQKEKYVTNYEASRQPDFVERIVAELQQAKVRAERNKKPQLCRIHDSGDFYDAKYVRKWIEIAKASPTFTFWVYTRSWRVPEIYPALLELAALANVQMWFSHDRDTGNPPRVEGIKWSWLQVDEELPTTPSDLIFREKKEGRQPARKIDGVQVCPQESGHTEDRELTCQDCTICFRDKATPELIQLISDNRNQKGKASVNKNRNVIPITPANAPAQVPDESWSREKLEEFVLQSDKQISDWNRKTLHRQFEIGAAWFHLLPQLKNERATRKWLKDHHLDKETMNERKRLYEAFQDRPQDLDQHKTMASALDATGVHGQRGKSKKLTEGEKKEALAAIEARIKAAKKRLSNRAYGKKKPITGFWAGKLAVRNYFHAIASELHQYEPIVRSHTEKSPKYAEAVRADLLLIEEACTDLMAMLPPPQAHSAA